MQKFLEVFFLLMVVMEMQNLRAYQVSPPCIVWFASLKGEEVVVGKSVRGNFFHGCHGNTEIHLYAKFHLYALHGLQV